LAGFFVRGAQFMQQRVAFPRTLPGATQRTQGAQEPGQFAPADGPFFGTPALALGQHIDSELLSRKRDSQEAEESS
jgi:hypothetical protein